MNIRDGERARLARQFIAKRGPEFNDSFSVESHFNVTAEVYEVKEIYALREVLEQYQRQAPDLVDFDFNHCSWDRVLYELQRAKDAAYQNEKRAKKRPWKAWRGVAAVSNVISPGFAALPDELCILQGGLAIMFSIARYSELNRLKILRAFENIPNIIQMAQHKAARFPLNEAREESVELHESVTELQKVLLRTLPSLITKLNPESIFGKILIPFQEYSIDNLLEAVQSSAERVRVCAERIMDDLHVDTHKTLTDSHHILRRMHTMAQDTGDEVGQVRKQLVEVLKQQKSIQLKLNAASGQNGLFHLLLETLKHQAPVKHNPESESDDTNVKEEPVPTATLAGLLSMLEVSHLWAGEDHLHVLRRGRSLDSTSIGQAAAMVKTRQFQQLLHSPRAGLLLVEGHGDRSQISKISPVSYLCANLVQAVRAEPQSAILIFFCGQHMATNDELQGPQGLVRSMLAQLILVLVQNEWIQESAPVSLLHLHGEVESFSLEDVCQLFHQLLGNIPSSTSAYCIVDGISYYERDQWREEYDLVMEFFSRIIADQKLCAYFKLLMTSPTKSIWLSSLEPEQRVSLRSAVGRTVLRQSESESSIRAALRPRK